MTDYIIIGGGVYGAATAWWLSKRGADVVILEERDVATRASGGPGRRGVRANARDFRELPLMRAAYELWPDLHQQLGVPQFYERTGHLLLAESAEEVARLEAHALVQNQLGIPTEILHEAALREREPELAPGIVAAAWCPLDGVADHGATTRAYVSAARQAGVDVRTHTEAESIEVSGGRARAVRLLDGTVLEAAKGVLLLSNSTVAPLLSKWQRLPVWSACFQVLVSAPLAQVPFSHLIGHVGRTVSLKREGADQVMISGGWRGNWDAGTRQGVPVEACVEGNVRDAVAVFPALAGLQVACADASHQESLSVDEIPLIDHVAGVPNLWFATGWCGHGWAIAPVIAELLAQWVATDQVPALLEPFRASRFA